VSSDSDLLVFECPDSWYDIFNVTIAFGPQDWSTILEVTPGFGDTNEILTFTDPIPVLPDSHLFAYLTWTQRQIFRRGSTPLLAPFKPLRTVYNMEVNSLFQTNPQAATATLTLVPRETYPSKFMQEYTNSSALDGLSSVGGLWTLVNGMFVLFFGANFLYYLSGRRPLSALGLAHLFQRRRLIRNRREDFPALHTEGGLPGSPTAGIIAFIRERLVDVDDAEGAGAVEDEESNTVDQKC